jgi:DNA-binding NarL/FixJ family response regulator
MESMPRGMTFTECGEHGSVVVFAFPIEADEPKLTEAEREVALHLMAGATNADIAAARGCAVRTVCNQVQSLFKKLGVRSRAELAAKMPVLG